MLQTLPNLAIAMTPLDWGIHIGAAVLLLFAARTMFTGKGKAQMGAGFAFVAAVVWTTAIGRHIDGFTILDGLQVGVGVLLLVPVLRVVFSHTGGSVTGAVISAILASVIAGPVIGRYFEAVTTDRSPEVERLRGEVEGLQAELDQALSTRDSVTTLAANERAKLEGMEIGSQADLEANPEAMKVMGLYAGYRGELDRLTVRIKELTEHKLDLETALAAIEKGDDASAAAKSETERIRARVKASAERDKTVLETYTERGKMMDLFEREFGGDTKAD